MPLTAARERCSFLYKSSTPKLTAFRWKATLLRRLRHHNVVLMKKRKERHDVGRIKRRGRMWQEIEEGDHAKYTVQSFLINFHSN